MSKPENESDREAKLEDREVALLNQIFDFIAQSGNLTENQKVQQVIELGRALEN
jgi:hypothetical protein